MSTQPSNSGKKSTRANLIHMIVENMGGASFVGETLDKILHLNRYQLLDQLETLDGSLSPAEELLAFVTNKCGSTQTKRGFARNKTSPKDTSPLEMIIREIIHERLKPEHRDYFDRILENVLKHLTASELFANLPDSYPFNALTRRGIESVVNSVYGGTVSHYQKKPLIEKVSKITESFYKEHPSVNIKLGCVIEYLRDHYSYKAVLPATNVLRKALKQLLPQTAFGLGRSCRNATKIVWSFFNRNPQLLVGLT